MNLIKNVLILIVLLALVGAIAYGIRLAAEKENNAARYSHPVTRQGASW